ncbi:type II restriction endonuclease [Methylocapsa palsarum]|uniref:Restriction endonuclease EcoRII, N-terminal n=1 Tax=Methylocapsa palsarum TaxID=1612308 RepID=A0A1I4DA99_9HYPH|nr:type II restriction endonuclease [Methylocapsa palsarum]SFK90035.1 Restriction endonuclease EcoRII, N-terminal [Methylocapsa palsarum]
MALADLTDWLDEYMKPGVVWFVKRLSANDTLATNAHQAGPYIPKEFLFSIFPMIARIDVKNPDHRFDLYIDSHADHREVRAVYYNTRRRGEGTRDESRLTNFGGRQSALLDPDSTGALAVFAFVLDALGSATQCHVWVCRHATEEDLIEDRIGPVEPGKFTIWTPATGRQEGRPPATRTSCALSPDEIPAAWIERFPTGEEIIRRTVEFRPPTGMNPDVRLVRRRDCEYELFLSVEQAVYLPRIATGFSSVEGFIGLAQTILQSRKSRSGNSLELHAREIFTEEGLRSGVEFQHKPVIENGKRPDFLFPSQAAYENQAFPADRLRMLAAKTTCKDRWRQVINEANRISTKHLLTLQEGVSEGQFREMQEAGVQLVVPAGIHDSYPDAVKPHLLTFESFIADIRLINLPAA